MTLNAKLMMAGSALLLSATMAFGAITSDQLATQFQADGYSFISIKTGITQIKVEAVKDGTRYEMVYDIATGNVIDSETYAIGPINGTDPGVIVRVVARDFEDDSSGSGSDDIGDDDSLDHDLFDDHGSDNDSVSGSDDDDDSSDDDHGGSDDGDDDHGSDDDHGDDD